MESSFQRTVERDFVLTSRLGTSGLSSENAPHWEINCLNGEISSSLAHMTSSYQTVKIPQIDIDLKYKTSYASNINPATLIKEDTALSSRTFADGTRAIVEPDHILLHALEKNTDFYKDNFEIEVFLVEEETNPDVSDSTINILKPLYFQKPEVLIEDNILLDTPIPALEPDNPNIVQYYFDILSDHEIDQRFVCQSIESLKAQNIYLDVDLGEQECEDVELGVTNIYETIASTPDVCEEVGAEQE